VIDFGRRLGYRLHPWQRLTLIHALELVPGTELYRFRKVLVLVARQNGKTLLKMILTLWRLYVQNARLVVGTAQDLSQAREVMNEGLIPMIESSPVLRKRFAPDEQDPSDRVGIWHKTLNDEYIRLDSLWRGNRPIGPRGPRYLIKALNRKAGRGLWDCAELNIDELREQTDFAAWSAVSKIVAAAENSQIWCMSNAGDQTSLVLNQLRAVGMASEDETLGLFEWSGEDGCAVDDEQQWAQANPSLGYSRSIQSIRSDLTTDPANVFRTEVLCQFVDALNAGVDMMGWGLCADPSGEITERDRVALVVHPSSDGAHVSAVAAAETADGRVRIDVVAAWESTADARRGIRSIRDLIDPVSLGWFPDGPGAALSATMRKLGAEPIKGTAVSESHMTLADRVKGRRILQPADRLLDAHMSRTSRVGTSKRWQFDEPGSVHVDAAWAAAGAVKLALEVPERPKPLGVCR
jgi:hypothetical protein